MKHTSYQLRIRAIIGMAIFITLVVLLSLYQLRTLTLSEQNNHLVGELKQLEELQSLFPRRSKHYINNAPRDFESYFRDVKVFHSDVILELDRFDEQLMQISSNLDDKIGFALPGVLSSIFSKSEQHMLLVGSIETATNDWSEFKRGFFTQLGENRDEPRLEWGAKYIVENDQNFSGSINNMTESYRSFLSHQNQLATNISKTFLFLITLIGLAIISWFYVKVIRRIGTTSEACQQVANGDFGYTLPVQGNDEITILSRAFNTLSSRSELILSMISDLQQAQDIEQALQTIVQASGSYLPIAWIGFVHVSADGKVMRLSNALPQNSLNNWANTSTDASQQFGQQLSDSLLAKKAVIMGDLRNYALQNPKELLIRDMVRATQSESLMAVPLSTNSGWEGFLLFGTRAGDYRQDQAELLLNLSSMIANSFEQITQEKR